jgi:hypothetical protein
VAIADILPILLASVLAWVGCLNLVAPNFIREELKVRDARRGLSGAAMEKVRLHVRGSELLMRHGLHQARNGLRR